jgi:uncharacterized membrane protein (DUF106 family)
MRRLLILAALLLATPAMAQQDLGPQLDSAMASVTTTVSNMRQQIILDQQRMAQMQQQTAAVTKERDELKAAAKPSAKDVPAPAVGK